LKGYVGESWEVGDSKKIIVRKRTRTREKDKGKDRTDLGL